MVKIRTSFQHQLNQSDRETRPIPSIAKTIGLVGMNICMIPCPSWKARTVICLESPIKSDNGAKIGIVKTACPELDTTKNEIILCAININCEDTIGWNLENT